MRVMCMLMTYNNNISYIKNYVIVHIQSYFYNKCVKYKIKSEYILFIIILKIKYCAYIL